MLAQFFIFSCSSKNNMKITINKWYCFLLLCALLAWMQSGGPSLSEYSFNNIILQDSCLGTADVDFPQELRDSSLAVKPFKPVLPQDEAPRWTQRRMADAKKLEKNDQQLWACILAYLAFERSTVCTDIESVESADSGFPVVPTNYSLPPHRGPPVSKTDKFFVSVA